MSLSLTGTLRRGLSGFVQHALPEHMKKLILYASLTGMLKEEKALDKQTLEKLNTVMGLSSDVEAMKLPVFVGSAIWKGEKPIDIPTELISKPWNESDAQSRVQTLRDVQSRVDTLLSKIPKWLRYGDDAKRRSDVQLYLLHCNEYLESNQRSRRT